MQVIWVTNWNITLTFPGTLGVSWLLHTEVIDTEQMRLKVNIIPWPEFQWKLVLALVAWKILANVKTRCFLWGLQDSPSFYHIGMVGEDELVACMHPVTVDNVCFAYTAYIVVCMSIDGVYFMYFCLKFLNTLVLPQRCQFLCMSARRSEHRSRHWAGRPRIPDSAAKQGVLDLCRLEKSCCACHPFAAWDRPTRSKAQLFLGSGWWLSERRKRTKQWFLWK